MGLERPLGVPLPVPPPPLPLPPVLGLGPPPIGPLVVVFVLRAWGRAGPAPAPGPARPPRVDLMPLRKGAAEPEPGEEEMDRPLMAGLCAVNGERWVWIGVVEPAGAAAAPATEAKDDKGNDRGDEDGGRLLLLLLLLL